MNNHTANDFKVSPDVHNKMVFVRDCLREGLSRYIGQGLVEDQVIRGVSLWRHIQQNLGGFSIDFKVREKIGEAVINAPAVQRASKASVIGWEAWEYVAIILTNTTKCRSCDRLIHFNGVRPQSCPSCKGAL